MQGIAIHSKKEFSSAFFLILGLQILLFVATWYLQFGSPGSVRRDAFLDRTRLMDRSESEGSLPDSAEGEGTPDSSVVTAASGSTEMEGGATVVTSPVAVAALPLIPLPSEAPPLLLPTAERQFGGKILIYRAKRGETLGSILRKNGGTKEEALAAESTLEGAGYGTQLVRQGDSIELFRSPTGGIMNLKLPLGVAEELVLSSDGEGGFTGTIVQDEVFETPRTVSGTIRGAFSASAREADLPYSVVDELVDLFSDRIDFRRDLKAGDTFSVLFQEIRGTEGRYLSAGPISAASIKNGGRLLVAIRYVGVDGKARYFDETGRLHGSSFLRYPVAFTRISSVFTESRFHPVLKHSRPHNGVDFAAPTGTPVRSIGDGTVVFAGVSGGSGKMIKIRHCARYTTAYLHLSKINKEVKAGSRVAQGQVIGAVGSTGLATGPHLHFSLYDRGEYVDPLSADLPQVLDKENLIPPSYLEATLRSLSAEHETIKLAADKRAPRV